MSFSHSFLEKPPAPPFFPGEATLFSGPLRDYVQPEKIKTDFFRGFSYDNAGSHVSNLLTAPLLDAASLSVIFL